MAAAVQQQSIGTHLGTALTSTTFPSPMGLGAPRTLISTLAVPVEGAEIKTGSFFIQSQQINWQKVQRDVLDSIISLCSKVAESC